MDKALLAIYAEKLRKKQGRAGVRRRKCGKKEQIMRQLKMGFCALALSFGAALLSSGLSFAAAPGGEGKPAALQQQGQARPGEAQISRGTERLKEFSGVHFRIQPYQESLCATPGYSAKLDFLTTESETYPHAAEIGRYISAQVLDALFGVRQESITQQMQDFCADILQGSGIPCENELYMQEKKAERIGDMLSVRYVYSYAAVGAAHPMHDSMTYIFALKPLFRVNSAADLFSDSGAAFLVVQKQLRQSLLAQKGEDGAPLLNHNDVEQGTQNWDMLNAFALTKSGIVFYFSPYAVAPYAAGTQKAELSYAVLKPLLKPFYARALGLN